jgi:hypothetical protein
MLGTKESRRALGLGLAIVGVICSIPGVSAAGGHCTDTANALFNACGFSVQDDFWVASARCINVSDPKERNECNQDAAQERRESSRLCRDQLNWRLAACGVIGEGRYDPDFDPAFFDSDFAHLTKPNPYFPLGIGNRWEYKSAEEVNTVEVLDRTKLIDGVRCIVVLDQVFRHGELTEDTNDWFAQAKDGTTWYCGEETKELESFNGDHPKLPELVSIEGSFKAGRDRDKPGIIFLDSSEVGAAYLEEFSLDNAEDVTEILSTSYVFGHDSALDEQVPQALAQALCRGDCIVTKNYSLLEPGIISRKYYAPGIGVFLEVEPDDQVVVRLTSCNFDPRCATLPPP